MLQEAFTALVTPAPWPVRRLGYVYEQIALDARYRRCRAAWASHLNRSQALVRAAIDRVPEPGGKAVILGSGAHYDLPLDALSGRFDQVVLIDILHRPPARRRALAWGPVVLETADVTDCVETVFRSGRAVTPPSPPDVFRRHRDAGLIVSLNLLSQLGLLPAAWLDRRGEAPAAIARFQQALIGAHLAGLGACRGVKCLITDTAWAEQGTDSIDPLFGARLPGGGTSWDWPIAPRPEAPTDRTHRVYGVVF